MYMENSDRSDALFGLNSGFYKMKGLPVYDDMKNHRTFD